MSGIVYPIEITIKTGIQQLEDVVEKSEEIRKNHLNIKINIEVTP